MLKYQQCILVCNIPIEQGKLVGCHKQALLVLYTNIDIICVTHEEQCYYALSLKWLFLNAFMAIHFRFDLLGNFTQC